MQQLLKAQIPTFKTSITVTPERAKPLPMSVIESNDFFEERRSFTEIKQEILGKLFDAWCNSRLEMLKADAKEAMLYIDLHAGDGYSPEQSLALPAKVKEALYKSVLRKPVLNESMRTFFYDASKAVLEHAGETMEMLPYYEEFIHPPVLLNNADNKAQMAELLATGCPAFVFLDPFSSRYAQETLTQVLKTGHSDLFMLLCPEKIAKAVGGKKVSQPLMELFGERLQKISHYCKKEKDNYKRQEFILNHFTASLNEKGQCTLLFKANLPDMQQPDHYLLFSSPDSQAYRIFKETMLPYTIFQEDEVPLFVANDFVQPQFSLFEERPTYTIPNLVERLTEKANLYKYKSIEKIYELDSCGTHYSRDNYVGAFEQLRKEGKIELLNAKTMQTIRQPTPASVVKYRL